jgi:hypothetical protein
MLKKLTVSLAGIAALALTGCGDGDDPGFGLTWDLVYLGSNDRVSCDGAGTPTVNLDVEGANDFKSHDSFPCKAMSGVSRVLPEGTYNVIASLQNNAGQIVSAVDRPMSLRRGGVVWLPPLTFDVQTFNLLWTVSRGGRGISCQEANAATVRLITRIGNEAPMQVDFPCLDPRAGTTGTSPAIPTGVYSVQVQLLDAGGRVLSEVPAMTFRVTDTAPADLPEITFEI